MIERIKVERESFLRTALLPYCSPQEITNLLSCNDLSEQLDATILKKVSETQIQKRCLLCAGCAWTSSLSGGLSTLVSLPLDFAIFAYQATKLAQELYILYGNKTMPLPNQEDQELLYWMLAGASGAITLSGSTISALGQFLYTRACKALSLHALSALPLVGCALHGGFSAYALYELSHEFIEKLIEQKAKNKTVNAHNVIKEIGEIIDVEYHEVETAIRKFCNLEKLKELYAYLEAGYIDEQQFHQLKQTL